MMQLRIQAVVGVLCLIATLQAGRGEAERWMAKGDSAFAAFDARLAANAYLKAYRLDSTRDVAAWKAARSIIDLAELSRDKARRAKLFRMALGLARRAIKLNPVGAKGYLYESIALGRVALDSGPKERVRLSRQVKAAVDTALALDPNDDAAWHVLGRWHRKLATLSWVEKKFANLFLGGVPKEASLEEAVACFKKAIALNPQSVRHHVHLGLTYLKMGEREKALAAFQKALALPRTDLDDPKLKKLSREEIKKLQ